MARHIKAGRNDLCPCGSGKKSKRCCQTTTAASSGWSSKVMIGLVLAVIVGAVVAGVMSFNEAPSVGPKPGQVWSPEHGHYH